MQTCKEILTFFELRKIDIESMHLHFIDRGRAIVTIHFNVSKEKIKYITGLVKKMDSVEKLELLEGRVAFKE